MHKVKITVKSVKGFCSAGYREGDHFFIEGSKLTIPEGNHICIWALQSMMPVFPIFQERDRLADDHWVKQVKQFSCPDPKGLVQYRLELIDDDSS